MIESQQSVRVSLQPAEICNADPADRFAAAFQMQHFYMHAPDHVEPTSVFQSRSAFCRTLQSCSWKKSA